MKRHSLLDRTAVRRSLGVAAALLLAGTLAACSGSSDDSSSSAGSNAQSEMRDQAATAPDAGKGYDGDATKSGTSEAARAAVGQKLVRRANLNLKVNGLTAAAQQIRGIAAQQNGVVISEELYAGEEGRGTSSTMTISVPADRLDATIGQIQKAGEVQFRNTSSEDVTGAYVDTEARVKSMTTSVGRIRDLLAKATSVNDLVALENELSQRQAELDSLTAQLNSLKDQVAMSPITISLSTDDFEPVTAGGFLSGLKSGWSAFVTSLSVLVTVLGAVLPFAAAAALVGVPLVWWLRRRRPVTPALAAPAPTGPTGPMPPASAG